MPDQNRSAVAAASPTTGPLVATWLPEVGGKAEDETKTDAECGSKGETERCEDGMYI